MVRQHDESGHWMHQCRPAVPGLMTLPLRLLALLLLALAEAFSVLHIVGYVAYAGLDLLALKLLEVEL